MVVNARKVQELRHNYRTRIRFDKRVAAKLRELAGVLERGRRGHRSK